MVLKAIPLAYDMLYLHANHVSTCRKAYIIMFRQKYSAKFNLCGIHPAKPGVCWLYPFAWIESDKQKAVIHATFQLTGDCPGFYVSRTLDPIKPVLNEYSEKIYNYNMAVSRTTRKIILLSTSSTCKGSNRLVINVG